MSVLGVLAALLVGAAPHPNSISRSRIVVAGPRAEVELAVQALTVVEELGGDADGDLELDAAELAALRPALEEYLLRTFELHAGDARVPGAVTRIETVRDPSSGDGFRMLGQWILCDLAFEHDAPLADLRIGFRLFEVMNSAHVDHATLVYRDEDPQTFVFALGEREWEHEPWAERRPRVLRAFAWRGARDALRAAATAALLVALLCASPRRPAAPAVLALAVAGAALGTAPGALELVALPREFAGLAAALSAAYVATDTLLRRGPRTPWLEAGVFGLVHGLDVGGGAAPAVAGEPLRHAAALGLDLGVAAALAPLALVAWALVRLIPGDRSVREGPEEAWLVPARARWLLCAAAALVGLALFARRAGFA